jgi:hypothetical protein
MSEFEGSLPAYHHVQKGPWYVLLCAMAAAFLTASWYLQAVPALAITFLVTGVFMLLLGVSFGNLTVSDEGDRLAVRFGPLPLFRRRIRYDEILEVERGRTHFLDGWGIHWSLWGGWVWNICGYDCVVLRLRRGVLKVGTNDPEGLADFVKTRMADLSGESQ